MRFNGRRLSNSTGDSTFFIWYAEAGAEAAAEDGWPASEVTEVDLAETDIDDDLLAIVARLTDLQWLYLEETRITDSGLKHLATLTNLKTLEIARHPRHCVRSF